MIDVGPDVAPVCALATLAGESTTSSTGCTMVTLGISRLAGAARDAVLTGAGSLAGAFAPKGDQSSSESCGLLFEATLVGLAIMLRRYVMLDFCLLYTSPS